jgi:hypothetical protein
MGYTHGKKWTEREIIESILAAKKALCVDYMPSKKEIKVVLGNESLANAITRHGGFEYFQQKLNLKKKQSDTLTGDINELYIKQLLEERGYSVEKTKPRHPYDLLVNGIVKIDVKSANPIPSKVRGMNEFVFSIKNEQPKCDLFVFVKIFKEKKDLFIIPSHFIKQSQLGIGETSKYEKYLNRFDYIDQYIQLFNQIVS